MVGGVRLGEPGEPVRRRPVEAAAVYDEAADRGAVAAEELGQRVEDDVGAVRQRPHEIRRRHGVVDHQRQAGRVRHVGDRADVQRVELGVGDRLRVQQLGARRDGPAEGLGVVAVHEGDVDAELLEGVAEQRDGAAVERPGRDHVVAGAGQVEDGRADGRLAGGEGDAGHSVFQRGHPLLEHRRGRVGDARVDVARLLQREQAGGVLAVAEHEGGGLVDGHGPRAGGGVGLLAGMQGHRLEAGAHGAPSGPASVCLVFVRCRHGVPALVGRRPPAKGRGLIFEPVSLEHGCAGRVFGAASVAPGPSTAAAAAPPRRAARRRRVHPPRCRSLDPVECAHPRRARRAPPLPGPH